MLSNRLVRTARRDWREWLVFAAFVGPNLLLFGIFTYYPLVQNGALAFSNYNLITRSGQFIGLRNFETVFGSTQFSKILANTFVFTTVSVLLLLAFGLMVALLLNQKLRGRNAARSILFSPTILAGAAIAIGQGNRLVVRGFGRTSFGRGAVPVEGETRLNGGATLQNTALVLATALLVEDGLLDLQAPVARYLSDNPSSADSGGYGSTTLWQLLLDAGGGSGQPAGGASTASWPAERWSILSQILEAVSGKSAQELFASRVLRPLGVEWHWKTTQQPPSPAGPPQQRPLADISAAATQIAPLAQMLLNGGIYSHRRILKRGTIDLFAARQRVGDAVRALGWNVGPWNGSTISRRAYGWDDPRGASLWMDPEKNLFVVFLPAEVQAGAEDRLRALRDELHRAAAEALGLAGSTR